MASDASWDFYPISFQAKIKVYNSRWSQSFSLDTVGNSGVVICNDKERKTKYRVGNSIRRRGKQM